MYIPILVLLTISSFLSCKSTNKNSDLAGTNDTFGMVCKSNPPSNAVPKEYPVSIIAQSINFNAHELTDTTATMFVPDPNGIRDGKFPETLFRIKKIWKPEKGDSPNKEKIYLLIVKGEGNATYTLKIPATAFKNKGDKFIAIYNEKRYTQGPDVKLKCEFKTNKEQQDNFDDNL